MKKTIHRWFWIWDYDIEEAWLNEMAASGLELTAVGWCTYHFDEGLPGEYIYRIELLPRLPIHPQSQQYISFIEDTGAECIATFMRWAFFRRRSELGGFDLFSDTDSRLKQLLQILMLLGSINLMNLSNTINMAHRWTESGNSAYLAILTLCAILEPFLVYGLAKVSLKYRKLKRARRLFE